MEEKTFVEDTPARRGGWSRPEKLLLAACVLFGLCAFLLGLTEIQIQSREKKLTQLEQDVDDIRDDAQAIRVVADQASGGADQQKQVQEAFLKLVQTVSAIEYEVCGGPCPAPPKE